MGTLVPVAGVMNYHKVIDIACGYFHCLAQTSKGLVWAWGNNNDL